MHRFESRIIFFNFPEYTADRNNLKIIPIFVIDLHTSGTVQYKMNAISPASLIYFW
jgi:hypothetical protein